MTVREHFFRSRRVRRAAQSFLQTAFGVLAAIQTAAAFGFLGETANWKAAVFVLAAAFYSAAAGAGSAGLQ